MRVALTGSNNFDGPIAGRVRPEVNTESPEIPHKMLQPDLNAVDELLEYRIGCLHVNSSSAVKVSGYVCRGRTVSPHSVVNRTCICRCPGWVIQMRG